MKVREIMTAQPITCSPDTSVAEAAALMLDADCGILPVTSDGRLVGVVTDRDMFIALATRNQLASDLKIGDVATWDVVTCRPEDEIHSALSAMEHRHVRRLPVRGAHDELEGVVSMNDIVLAADARKGMRTDDVLTTLKAICAHDRAVVSAA